MSESGVVQLSHAPLRVETVGAEVRRAIWAGELRPGEVVRLRDVAEVSQVRLDSLRLVLESLEHDGLFALRGDVLTVAALNLAELRSTQSFHRAHMRDLAARASGAITGQALDRVEALIPVRPQSYADPASGLVQTSEAFFRAAWQPVATRSDYRIWFMTMGTFGRYLMLGLHTVDEECGPAGVIAEDREHLALCQDIVDCYRSESSSGASAVMMSYLDRGYAISERSFELVTSDACSRYLSIVRPVAPAERPPAAPS